jgi:hypothetical protein
MLIQGSSHRFQPLIKTLSKCALTLMKFFVFFIRSFKRTSLVEATYCHLVDQTFSHKVFLNFNNFSLASGAFSFLRSTSLAKSMRARMKSHRTFHECLAGWTVQKFWIVLVHELIFFNLFRLFLFCCF